MKQLLCVLLISAVAAQEPLVENSRYDLSDLAWDDSPSDAGDVRMGRIVGGGAAARGQFPFAAYVNVAGTTACGAALIADNWLLTAGQCIYSYMQWTIYLGVVDLVTSDDYSVIIESTSGLEHPGYDAATLRHNIGLLSVPGRVFFNPYVTPAALPRYSEVDSTFDGVDIMVTAWGSQATGRWSCLRRGARGHVVRVLPAGEHLQPRLVLLRHRALRRGHLHGRLRQPDAASRRERQLHGGGRGQLHTGHHHLRGRHLRLHHGGRLPRLAAPAHAARNPAVIRGLCGRPACCSC